MSSEQESRVGQEGAAPVCPQFLSIVPALCSSCLVQNTFNFTFISFHFNYLVLGRPQSEEHVANQEQGGSLCLCQIPM